MVQTKVYWKGGNAGSGSQQKDPDNINNWVTSSGGSTVISTSTHNDMANNDVIFDQATAADHMLISSSTSRLTYRSMTFEYHANTGYVRLLRFSGAVTLILNGLKVKKSNVIGTNGSGSDALTIKFTGTPRYKSYNSDAEDLYFITDSSSDSTLDLGTLTGAISFEGAFHTGARSATTMLFEPSNGARISLQNGIYPKLDFDCASTDTATLLPNIVYSEADGSNSNNCRAVFMAGLDIDSSFTVKPKELTRRDRDAKWVLEGPLTLTTNTLDMGFGTFELISTQSEVKFPVTGTSTYGTDKNFSSTFTNIIIGSPAQSNYQVIMEDNTLLSCENLTISAGARFYGPIYGSSSSAEIHTIKKPKVEGDWNFGQVAEGVYRTIGTKHRLSVSSGGTGLDTVPNKSIVYGDNKGALQTLAFPTSSPAGKVLAINSGGNGFEWSATAGGSGGVTVQDEGSALATTADILNFVGSGVVASGTGATKTITITDTDTNTNQLTTFTLRGTTNTNPTTVNHGDTITIAAGTGITTTSTSDGTITIANTVTDTNTNQLTEFTLAGDSGSSQTIAHGNTLTIAGGTNITSVASATDTITLNVDDAFLKNDANDSTTGTITAAGFATTNGPVNFVRNHASAVTMVVEQDGTGDIATFKGASDELLSIRRAGSLKFNLSTSGGAADEAIMTYRDTGGDERNFMSIDAGTVVLHNRGPDGDVEIRGNSGSAGSGGETTIAKFEDTLVTLSKDTTLEKTGSPTFSIKTSSSNSQQANLTLHGARNADGNPIGQIAFTNNDDSGTNTGTYTAAKIFAFNDGGDKAGGLQFQTVPAGSSTTLATALTIQEDTNIVTAGNLTVGGNLIVSGDSITVNAETITTEEAMLSLGIGQTATDADALDFGFYGTYDVSDTQKYRGIFADASDSGKFKLFKDLQAEPTTTVNTAGTGYAVGTLVANLEGNVTGDVTGNVSGTAASVTGAAQTNITSVGTLTSLTMTSPLTINHAGSDVFADIIGPLNRNLRFVLRDNGDTDAFIFRNAGGTDIMKLLRTGTLLIGKSAPVASVTRNLEVEGSIAAASDGTGGVGFHMKNSEGEFILYTDDGNLLIKDYAGSDTYPFKIMGTAETDTLKIMTGGDVRVKDRLGVGTDTPSTKLEVVGDITAERLNLDKSSGYSSIEVKGGDGAFIDLGNKDGTHDDFDARLITDGTGLDIIVTAASNHITLKTNNTQRFKVEDSAITMYPPMLQFSSGSAPTIKGGAYNPLTIYGNTDGTATSTTNNVVTRSTSAAIDFDVNASQQLAMRIKDNKDVDVYGVLSGPGIAEGAFGANSFHLGDTGSTEAHDWYEVFRWTPNATMSATNSNQYRNFAAKFNVLGRGLQRINYDIYVRGEYGVQDSNGWWAKEFIIDGLDISQAIGTSGGSADTDSPDADSIFKMVYNAGTSLSMPYASLYMKRDENWEIRTCNLISMFTNCVFEFKDTNIGETAPTNDGETGSADLSPSLRRKLRVDTNNQLINGVGATGIYFDDTNDRLGVGTSSPSTPLHVRTTTTSLDNLLLLENNGGSGSPGVGIKMFSNVGTANYLEILHDAFGHTNFKTVNGSSTYSQQLYLQNNGDVSFGTGDVGIGTTSPGTKLHVAGGGNQEIKIDSTSDGRASLLLEGYKTSDATFAQIAATNDADSVASIGFNRVGANDAADITFNTQTTSTTTVAERMRIDSSGNVGIGTTTPSTELHLSGADHPSIRITGTDNAGADPAFELLGTANSFNEGGQLWYDNGTGVLHLASLYNNDAADIQFHTKTAADRSTSNVRMTIAGDGNVGIGTTSPAFPLEVDGFISTASGIVHMGDTNNTITFGTDTQSFNTNSVARMTIASDGAVAVAGAFSAATKSFDIEHPTKEGKRLHHGSLEGPEHGVYIRGKNNSGTIHLPDYWKGLVDKDSITVQLTAIGKPQELYVREIKNNRVRVAAKTRGTHLNYFYFIQAERKDVEKMVVEY